ncbi:MAG: MFS transporter [Minisyncoccia bacterium]
MRLDLKKILYLINFLISFGYNAVSKIFPAFLATFSYSAFQISLVSSVYNIGRLIMGIFGGFLADRFGKRNSLFISMMAIGIFSSLLAYGRTIEWFTMIFFFLGIFSSLFYLSINAIVTVVNEKKGKSLSKMEAAYQVGFIAGPFVGGAIALTYGMNPLFFAWSIIMLIGGVLISRVESQDSRNSMKSVANDYLKIVRSDPLDFLLLIVIGTIFIGTIEGARDIIIPLYAVDLGYDIFKIGAIFTISSIVTMIGIIPLGNFADKAGRKKVLILSFAMIGSSFILLRFFTGFLSISLLVGLLSLGRTAGLMGVRAFASDISSHGSRATSLSAIESILSIGRIAGALLAGFLKDSMDVASIFRIFFWFSIMIIAVYLIFLKRKKISAS